VTEPAIRLDGVHFAYPDGHAALQGVDLTVLPGERVAVLGPNGAGKSTLCLHLNGILRPQVGSVTIGGRSTAQRDLTDIRRRVGLVFQDPDDQLFMPTVAQDVAFGPANLGLDRAEIDRRVAIALAQVGLPDVGARAPHHLSFGQRKRVATATVLAMQPDVLVLDEPSANLDPRARREFGEILSGLPQTLLLVTHDLPYALELCDRGVILDAGRVVADGPLASLLADADLLAAHALELPYGFRLDALDAPWSDGRSGFRAGRSGPM
jgi:cobalt/nickel transport system ATP-binding protein